VIRTSLVPALWIIVLAAVQFFWFPGHTMLQSDTQIYLPMLERIWNPSLLGRDLIATRPHLTFTLYDEIALPLRALTGAGFETVLLAQQFAYRALGIAGIYLIARSFALTTALSLLVVAMVSLGAAVVGPAVLTVEYEPVPRGFALPFVFLSWGLLLRQKPVPAALAGTAALAFHPPTAVGPWLILLIVLAHRRDWGALAALALGPVVMLVSAIFTPPSAEPAHSSARLDESLAAIQQMRASYNWVSTWIGRWWTQYAWQLLAAMVALWRIRNEAPPLFRVLALILPIIGVLSVPMSYLLLEIGQWSLVPQFQPARYLLYVTVFAMLSSALAAVLAARRQTYLEASAFFFACLSVPREFTGSNLEGVRLFTVLASTLIATTAAAGTWRPLLLVAALTPYILLPTLGSVRLYPNVHTPQMAQLVAWARSNTQKDSVFHFHGVGRSLLPGIFRARAQRALWVDWKTGGQANFQNTLARLWAERWRSAQRNDTWPEEVDYVIVPREGEQPVDKAPAYQNDRWVVYKR
jgi:hypothetical protein